MRRICRQRHEVLPVTVRHADTCQVLRVGRTSPVFKPHTFLEMNNGQEAFRRLANQLRTSGGGGGGPLPGGPKGLFAGSGLLIVLVAGGFALNASLFNGA